MNPARIVVVDDNTADVNLLRMALDQRHEPYRLDVLQTSEEAFRFVREYQDDSHEQQPCVILLDLHLPKHDGLAILKAIRHARALSHIHVVLLSGMASPRERETIAAMGAFYRQKPFDLNDYLELGAEILALCANPARAAA